MPVESKLGKFIKRWRKKKDEMEKEEG